MKAHWSQLLFNTGLTVLVAVGLVSTQHMWVRAEEAEVESSSSAMGAMLPHAFSGTLSYQGFVTTPNGAPLKGAQNFTIKLYDQSNGGTALLTEIHANVPVYEGLFNILIGSQTTGGIPHELWKNPLYVEIVLNGETLTPRELVKLGTSQDTLGVGANVSFIQKTNNPIMAAYDSHSFHLSGSDVPLSPAGGWYRGGWLALTSLDHTTLPGSVRVVIARDNALANDPVFDVVRTNNDGTAQQLFTTESNGNIVVYGPNIKMNGTTASNVVFRHDGSRTLHLLPWAGAGHAWDQVCIGCGANANLIVRGSITQGAIIEKNLQTEAEFEAGRIDRFSQGDVLCWDAAAQQLAHCAESASPLVVAVADEFGRPIVMGAEPIKVLGEVTAGDLLVASDVAGYAMAWRPTKTNLTSPPTGVVIAKALEGHIGGKGLIKAMILNQ